MNRIIIACALVGFGFMLGLVASWQPVQTVFANITAPKPAAAMPELAMAWLDEQDADSYLDDLAAPPRREREGRRSEDRDRGREMTPELIERIIDVAREIDASMADRLRAICDADPEEFERVVRTTGRRLVGLADLKERDSELYQTKIMEMQYESQGTRIAQQIIEARQADDESRERILREQLQTNIRVQVALSLKARGDSLNRLKEHIQALQQELERDAANFDQTVEERMEQVIRRAERDADAVATRRR